MTDRELLELAAKAAGFDLHTKFKYEYDEMFGFRINDTWWNPLKVGSDAIALLIELKGNLKIHDNYAEVDIFGYKHKEYSWIESNIYDATRRAIVRAAAEIGKTK